MSQNIENIIPPGEVEFYVKTLEPTNIKDLGCMRWFEKHDRLQKLHQQTILEASSLREETVKEAFVSLSKIPVLVHEAICVSVWREKVLPSLLQVDREPKSTFMPYMVLYHEVTAVAELEALLFHQDSCEALEDTSIDLIDFCASNVITLASLIEDTCHKEIEPRKTIDELQYQQKVLAFDIGIRSITILSYLSQAIDRLPLTATTRFYNTHDIPIMFKNLLDTTPWVKRDSKGKLQRYQDGKWKTIQGEETIKISRTEAQIWLCLRHLLLDTKCLTYYEFNDYHKSQLTKGRLHDALLDQLSPLIELKVWLNNLSISAIPSSTKAPIIVEIIPQIKKAILKKNQGKWPQILQKHTENFFSQERDTMIQAAESLKATFNLDTLEALATETHSCVVCGDKAMKKCSRCKSYWFCSRECQVKNWVNHKPICDKIINVKAQ